MELGKYKLVARLENGTEVTVSEIPEAEFDTTDGNAIGEMELRSASPFSLEFTCRLSKRDMMRFAMTATGLTNNSIRMSGGRAVRFVNINKAETTWN